MTQTTQDQQQVGLAQCSNEADVSGHLMALPDTRDFAKKIAEAIEAATKTCPPVRLSR